MCFLPIDVDPHRSVDHFRVLEGQSSTTTKHQEWDTVAWWNRVTTSPDGMEEPILIVVSDALSNDVTDSTLTITVGRVLNHLGPRSKEVLLRALGSTFPTFPYNRESIFRYKQQGSICCRLLQYFQPLTVGGLSSFLWDVVDLLYIITWFCQTA